MVSQPARTEGQRDYDRWTLSAVGRWTVVLKQSSSDTSTSTSSLSCWYRQGGCCGDFYTTLWPHHLRLIRPGNIYPSSVVHFCWVRVNYSLSFLVLAERSATKCGLPQTLEMAATLRHLVTLLPHSDALWSSSAHPDHALLPCDWLIRLMRRWRGVPSKMTLGVISKLHYPITSSPSSPSLPTVVQMYDW